MASQVKTVSRDVRLGGIYHKGTALYESLYQQLEAPQHAAPNLDALFDVLTAEINGPISITWAGYNLVEHRYMTENQKIAEVMQEAADERDDLTLTLMRDGEPDGLNAIKDDIL